jgi:hypothetical protein
MTKQSQALHKAMELSCRLARVEENLSRHICLASENANIYEDQIAALASIRNELIDTIVSVALSGRKRK